MVPDLTPLKKLAMVCILTLAALVLALGVVAVYEANEIHLPDNAVLWEDITPTKGYMLKTGEHYLMEFTIYDTSQVTYHNKYLAYSGENVLTGLITLLDMELEVGKTYTARVIYMETYIQQGVGALHVFTVIQVVNEVDGYLYGPDVPKKEELEGQMGRVIGDILKLEF